MRKNLYMFRHDKKLSQAGIADKIGCHRKSYADIENGVREGRTAFWDALKQAFGLTDAKIKELKKVDKKE